MPNNELQELLGGRFEGYTHSSNESVWNAIESELHPKESNRAGIWFWIFNGLAATLLVGLILESSFSEKASSSSTRADTAENSIVEVSKESDLESDSKNEFDSAHQEITNQTESGNSNIETDKGNSNFNNSKSKSVPSHSRKSLVAFESKPIELKQEEEPKTETSNTGNSGQPSEVEYSNLLTRPLAKSIYTGEFSNTLPNTLAKKVSYQYRVPIHVGFEFTHLRRAEFSNISNDSLETGYPLIDDKLATERQFEFSLFTQFDFTRRFSASIGFGYSSAILKSHDAIGVANENALSSTNTKIESNLRLFTIPVQAKMTVFRKNRFDLSAGLTLQGEFGRIQYSKESPTQNIGQPGDPQFSTEQLYETSKETIRQFTFEPFVQLSARILPRLTTFANIGYRSYFGRSNSQMISTRNQRFFNADVGIQFQIR